MCPLIDCDSVSSSCCWPQSSPALFTGSGILLESWFASSDAAAKTQSYFFTAVLPVTAPAKAASMHGNDEKLKSVALDEVTATVVRTGSASSAPPAMTRLKSLLAAKKMGANAPEPQPVAATTTNASTTPNAGGRKIAMPPSALRPALRTNSTRSIDSDTASVRSGASVQFSDEERPSPVSGSNQAIEMPQRDDPATEPPSSKTSIFALPAQRENQLRLRASLAKNAELSQLMIADMCDECLQRPAAVICHDEACREKLYCAECNTVLHINQWREHVRAQYVLGMRSINRGLRYSLASRVRIRRSTCLYLIRLPYVALGVFLFVGDYLQSGWIGVGRWYSSADHIRWPIAPQFAQTFDAPCQI